MTKNLKNNSKLTQVKTYFNHLIYSYNPPYQWNRKAGHLAAHGYRKPRILTNIDNVQGSPENSGLIVVFGFSFYYQTSLRIL